MFDGLMRRYAAWVVRNRWAVLICTLGITALLFFNMGALKLENDPDLWAPQDHPFIQTTHQIANVFGGRHVAVIGIAPTDGDITNPALLKKVERLQKAIVEMPESIDSNVISLAARKIKDISGDHGSLTVRQFTDSSVDLDAALKRNPIYDNSLVAADRSALALIADFRISGTYTPIVNRIRELADSERDASVRITLGGEPFESANGEDAMNRMPEYFGLAFLIIMAVQYLAFRSIQGMLLPMVSSIVSVVWALGMLPLAGFHLDPLNATTPILIIAVATGHSVQILKRYYEELELVQRNGEIADRKEANQQAVIRSLEKVGPVTLVAGLIAALAFLSLAAADIELIRNFGMLAALGIVAILAIELTMIPSLRAILPAQRQQQDQQTKLDRALSAAGRYVGNEHGAKTAFLASIIALGALLLGLTRLNVYNSFKDYSPYESVIRTDGRFLDEKFGGTNTMIFLVEGASDDAIKSPSVLKAMQKLQNFLSAHESVGKTVSVADLIRRLNVAMNDENLAFDIIPEQQDLIAQYFVLYSLSSSLTDFDNLVDENYRRAAVWTYLKTDDTREAQSLYEGAKEIIRKEFPEGVTVTMGGNLAETIAINDSLVDTKVNSILQMSAVVLVMASLMFRSFVAGVLVAIPLLAIVLANLGAMGWLGIPLDMGTATTTAMVVGIGADYEIYLLYRLREEYAKHGDLGRALESSLLTSGKAVIYVAISIAGGYMALLGADFQFYPRLGATMIVTMLVSCVLSIVLLRSIVTLLRPNFIVSMRVAVPGAV